MIRNVGRKSPVLDPTFKKPLEKGVTAQVQGLRLVLMTHDETVTQRIMPVGSNYGELAEKL